MSKNSPQFAVFETAWRFYGVDLTGVPGISAGLLCALISEVGTREQLLAAFPTPERFASWMGLCPDNRISGCKVLKAKTRKVQSRLAGAFRLGVFGPATIPNPDGRILAPDEGQAGQGERNHRCRPQAGSHRPRHDQESETLRRKRSIQAHPAERGTPSQSTLKTSSRTWPHPPTHRRITFKLVGRVKVHGRSCASDSRPRIHPPRKREHWCQRRRSA